MIRILTVLILPLLFALRAHAVTPIVNGVDIRDPWIAEAPPVSKVNAGYMKISNGGDADIRVVSVNCANYSSAEFHRTVEIDGIARMRRQPALDIPAGSELALEPGSYHVMLFNPVRALHSGETTACRLQLEGGGVIEFDAAVRRSSDDHSHHHH